MLLPPEVAVPERASHPSQLSGSRCGHLGEPRHPSTRGGLVQRNSNSAEDDGGHSSGLVGDPWLWLPSGREWDPEVRTSRSRG